MLYLIYIKYDITTNPWERARTARTNSGAAEKEKVDLDHTLRKKQNGTNQTDTDMKPRRMTGETKT